MQWNIQLSLVQKSILHICVKQKLYFCVLIEHTLTVNHQLMLIDICSCSKVYTHGKLAGHYVLKYALGMN